MIRKSFQNKGILFLLTFVLFFAVSCRKDGVLSPREMRKVLVDMHVFEGVINTRYPGIPEREQVYYYNAIFQKHGITKAQFDSSLVYYTKNPKSFERIYSRVLEDVTELNQDVLAYKYHPLVPDSTMFKPSKYRIWKLADKYVFSKDSTRTRLAFSISDPALLTHDYYYLKFRLRIAPRDSSLNPHAAFRIHYADGVVDSVYHKTRNDSVLRSYKFIVRANRNFRIDSITGVLLGSTVYKGVFSAYLDSISLEREYIPAYQDSLKLHLDTIPPVKTKHAGTPVRLKKSSGDKNIRKIDSREITR